MLQKAALFIYYFSEIYFESKYFGPVIMIMIPTQGRGYFRDILLLKKHQKQTMRTLINYLDDKLPGGLD